MNTAEALERVDAGCVESPEAVVLAAALRKAHDGFRAILGVVPTRGWLSYEAEVRRIAADALAVSPPADEAKR